MLENIFKNWFWILVWILVAVYAFGGFDTYWTHHKMVYDPKLNRQRCIDKDTGDLMDIDPPCVVLTLDGQAAIKRRTEKCVRKGGSEAVCKDEAWTWMVDKIAARRSKGK